MRKWIFVLLVPVLVSAGLVAISPGVSAEPYPGTVETTPKSGGPDRVKKGKRPKTHVNVKTSGNAKPEGRLRVTYTRKAGGFKRTKTMPYEGGRVVFRGPKLKKPGKYFIKVTFLPAKDSVYKRSTRTYRIKVVR